MRSDGVEVAQRDTLQTVVRRDRVAQDILAHLFGVAVSRRGRFSGRELSDGQVVGLAVNRRRRREDYVAATELAHEIHHVHERSEIVAVIFHGIGHRLAHSLVGGEVNHRVEFVLLEDLAESLLVAAVDIDERHVDARDFAYALHSAHVGVRQVVGHDHVVTRVDQLDGGMRTYISRSARDQYHLFHIRAI